MTQNLYCVDIDNKFRFIKLLHFKQDISKMYPTEDGERHFCDHGDVICHPNSIYVSTKLYGTSTCGCNNNTVTQKELFSRFLPSMYAGHVGQTAVRHRTYLNHVFYCVCRTILMPRLCLAPVEEDPVAMETRCSMSGAPPGDLLPSALRSSEETPLGRVLPGGTANLATFCIGLPRFVKTRTRKFALTVIYQKEAPDCATIGPVGGTCQKIGAAEGACHKCIASDCLGYVEISVEDVLGGSLRIDTTIQDTSGELSETYS